MCSTVVLRNQPHIFFNHEDQQNIEHLFEKNPEGQAAFADLRKEGHQVRDDDSAGIAIKEQFKTNVERAPRPEQIGRVWRVDTSMTGAYNIPGENHDDIYCYDYKGFISTNLVENCMGYVDTNHPDFSTMTYLELFAKAKSVAFRN